jgi:hypothetical protein
MIFAAVGPAIYGPTIAASERQGAGLPAGPTQQPSVLTGLRVLAQMLGAEMVGPAADHPTRHAAIADDDATMTTADSTPTSPGTPCRRKRSSQPAACGQEGENLRSGSMSSVSSPSTECQGRDEDEDIVPPSPAPAAEQPGMHKESSAFAVGHGVGGSGGRVVLPSAPLGCPALGWARYPKPADHSCSWCEVCPHFPDGLELCFAAPQAQPPQRHSNGTTPPKLGCYTSSSSSGVCPGSRLPTQINHRAAAAAQKPRSRDHEGAVVWACGHHNASTISASAAAAAAAALSGEHKGLGWDEPAEVAAGSGRPPLRATDTRQRPPPQQPQALKQQRAKSQQQRALHKIWREPGGWPVASISPEEVKRRCGVKAAESDRNCQGRYW